MSLDQQRRTKYYTLGNVVILLSGVLSIAAGIILGAVLQRPVLDWPGILLNIGSDLIVVAIAFFIGKILLIDPQQDIEERMVSNLQNQMMALEKIEMIESKLNSPSTMFLTRDQLNTQQAFEQFCEQAQDLYLGGVALRRTGLGHRSMYRKKLEKGARLRFALLDPESPDVAAIAANWQTPKEHVENDIRSTLAELARLQNMATSQNSGSVEIRLLKREPAFSFALRNVGTVDACLRADMRVFGLDAGLRPGWEFTVANDPWFQRFVQVCEALWDDSKPWTDSS